MLTPEHVFQAIQHLPVPERLRLIARVLHDLADATVVEALPLPPAPAAAALLGLFADEPDLVDEVSAMAYAARKTDELRTRREDDALT